MFIKTKSKNQIFLYKNQSAGNRKMGSSETIRKLSVQEINWLAGVIDGDGNFDIRGVYRAGFASPKNPADGTIKKTLKQIRITQHPRDARVLYQVKELLGGTIRPKGNKYIIWTISNKKLMHNCLNLINGHIRLKVPGFKEACLLYGINYIEANYIIEENSAYLAGLVDTDGSVVWNYQGDRAGGPPHPNGRGPRIDLFLEFQQNEYSQKLDLSHVIPGAVIKVYEFEKRNQTRGKIFYSKRFAYQSLENLLPVYNYFKLNRLYNDFKFYRIMQIKRFLDLRIFHNYPTDSPEYYLYYNFAKAWYTHMNLNKPLPLFLKLRLPERVMI